LTKRDGIFCSALAGVQRAHPGHTPAKYLLIWITTR
jgi:hypothetical protein